MTTKQNLLASRSKQRAKADRINNLIKNKGLRESLEYE